MNPVYIILLVTSVAGMYENLEAATVRNRMLKIPLVMDESKQCNKSNPQLGLDEACLEVISSATNPISLWAQSEECEMVNLLTCCL